MNFDDLESAYDLVVVGGGVTGAGVFHRAVHMGLRPLLLEARDFAWGTSSRSSKMVHGGLRYLKQGRFMLTRSSVMERQRLLSVYPGLVTPLEFIMPIYKDLGPSRTAVRAGLSIYSFMAGQRQHQDFDREAAARLVPGIRSHALVSAVGFRDAQVDDARLVLRLIFDACDLGGHALNYTRVLNFARDARGRVRGVIAKDGETGREREIRTRAVINATGAFAEALHPSPVKDYHIRPLRGSHLIFPGSPYGMDRVLSFIHPRDSRPVFIFPWEGCLVLGTTDVDFNGDLHTDPGITREETDYLMEGLAFILPGLNLSLDQALASMAGVRPVLSRRKKSASKESREHVVWKDKGLVTVTGGKLTTFSLLARDALKAAAPFLPDAREMTGVENRPVPSALAHLSPDRRMRLLGRYGARAHALAAPELSASLDPVGTTHTLWAELIHGAASERVRHLSDLLLRRVRIGLLLPRGGMEMMDSIRARLTPVLGWDDTRWEREIRAYGRLWNQAYAPVPEGGRRG